MKPLFYKLNAYLRLWLINFQTITYLKQIYSIIFALSNYFKLTYVVFGLDTVTIIKYNNLRIKSIWIAFCKTEKVYNWALGLGNSTY